MSLKLNIKNFDAADNQFTSKSYAKSRVVRRAKRMNPEDRYPAQRINEIEKLIREILKISFSNKIKKPNKKSTII